MSANDAGAAHVAIGRDDDLNFDPARNIHAARQFRIRRRSFCLDLALTLVRRSLLRQSVRSENGDSSGGQREPRPAGSHCKSLLMSETTPRRERHVGCQRGARVLAGRCGMNFWWKFMRTHYLQTSWCEEKMREYCADCLNHWDLREAGLTLRRDAACPFVQCAVISNSVSFCD